MKTPKIDMSIDYSKLLKEARSRRRARNKVAELYFFYEVKDSKHVPADIHAEYIEAESKWLDWKQRNITDRNLNLEVDYRGNITAISLVLAGRRKK